MGWLGKNKDKDTSYTDEEAEQARLENMMREIEVMDEQGLYKEFLVSGALMACEYGKKMVRLSKNDLSFVYCDDKEILTDKAIPSSGTFGLCHAPSLYNDGNRPKVTSKFSANESVTGKEVMDFGPKCTMEISQTWLGTDETLVIWDPNDKIYRSIPTTTAYLLCYCGGGCIFPVDSGQKVKTKLETIYPFMSKKGVQLLKYFEFPTDVYSLYKDLYYLNGKEIIGGYPHYVGDGGITFGFGHCIKEPWRREGNNEAILKKYISEDIDHIQYDDGLGDKVSPRKAGSIPVLFTDADDILYDDILKYYNMVINALIGDKIAVEKYQQYQIDALIIRTFPFGEVTSKLLDVLTGGGGQADWDAKLGTGPHGERSVLCGKLFYQGDYMIKGQVPFEEKHIISDAFYKKYFTK